jgi:uncharacterized protein YukE
MYVMEAELLARINASLVRLNSLMEQAATLVNNGLRWLPPWVQQEVLAGWDRLCANLRELWDQLKWHIEAAGSPSALRETAATWNIEVGRVSGLAGYASLDQSRVPTVWEGDASDAYRETLPAQQKAIEHVRSAYSVPISTVLHDMAGAIVVFWTTIIAALVAFIAAFVGALATKATIVGIPAGIGIILAAIGVCAAAVLTAVLMLESAAASATNTLAQHLHDDGPLPGGSWPRSTVV